MSTSEHRGIPNGAHCTDNDCWCWDPAKNPLHDANKPRSVTPERQRGHVGPDEEDWGWRDWALFMGVVLFVGAVVFAGAALLEHFYG